MVWFCFPLRNGFDTLWNCTTNLCVENYKTAYLCPKGAVVCAVSINSSLSGHCHEKSSEGSHDKEKYFDDHHESVTGMAEGHSGGGTEDTEILTQRSVRDPSILKLESKSALKFSTDGWMIFLDFLEELSSFLQGATLFPSACKVKSNP